MVIYAASVLCNVHCIYSVYTLEMHQFLLLPHAKRPIGLIEDYCYDHLKKEPKIIILKYYLAQWHSGCSYTTQIVYLISWALNLTYYPYQTCQFTPHHANKFSAA